MYILTRPGHETDAEMLEKARVRELIEFERFCRDNALWEEMKKCFSEDSSVAISWYNGSGHGFVDASAKMQGRAPHKIYNTEVWLRGERAVAIMVTTIEKRQELEGVPVDLRSDAKLVFCVEKQENRWFIKSFTAIYEQDSLTPALPTNSLAVPAEELAKSRPSYACLSYTLARGGYAIDSALPGIDRPDLVDALYRRVDAWLTEKTKAPGQKPEAFT